MATAAAYESFGTNALTVTNAAGGTIAGGRYGVFAGNGNVATVTNDGLHSRI